MRSALRWAGWFLFWIATGISLLVLGGIGAILIVYLLSLHEP